jgi:hypothetical protein
MKMHYCKLDPKFFPRGSSSVSFLFIIACLIMTTLTGCTSAGEAYDSKSGLAIYIINPITKQKILPDTPVRLFPLAGKSGENRIFVQACRGEFEPASFVMRAGTNMSGMRIASSDLSGPNGSVIPSSAIDVRIVKCWYQAGSNKYMTKDRKILVPELLLKDDRLVKVDQVTQMNYLKVRISNQEQFIDITTSDSVFPDNAEIHDATSLQPFDVAAKSNKQVWVTFAIPTSAVSGKYIGTITLKSGTILLNIINVELTVLPFDLDKPVMVYGLYYRGQLRKGAVMAINSEDKSDAQYAIEMQNMRDHGVLYPTIYQSTDSMLGQSLAIRESAGLPVDKLYSAAISPNNKYLPLVIATYKKAMLENGGFQDLYIIGLEETPIASLSKKIPLLQAAHNAGVKTFGACYVGSADILGNILDQPILPASMVMPNEVAKWHSYGEKVFMYSYPQVGVEDPNIYRERYGIPLLCSGTDGAMNYAYQHSFGHIWNDFDSLPGFENYRDHVFAYPRSDGVIDTVEWEGFREAVDDVRYLTTLAKRVNASAYQSICNSLLTNSNLDSIRKSIIDKLLAFYAPH